MLFVMCLVCIVCDSPCCALLVVCRLLVVSSLSLIVAYCVCVVFVSRCLFFVLLVSAVRVVDWLLLAV